MMKPTLSAASAALWSLVLLAPHARADGGLLPPWGYQMWEPAQVAVLCHDQATQTEDLILYPRFRGTTNDFGWVIPVPALPTLETADAELFSECARLTAPIYWGCLLKDEHDIGVAPTVGRDGGIIIYEEQTVGVYRTLTLGADNAGALADSLEAWGYLYAGNRPEVQSALQFYIDKSWYFVAIRTDPATPMYKDELGYWAGAIAPIRLRFSSPAPVYPLRISALSATEDSEVLLYVLAAHRMDSPGARTEYANRLEGEELERVRQDYPHLRQILTGPDYLTKLRAYRGPADMTDDLVLARAPSDREFRQIHYTGLPSTELLMLAMVGIMLTRSRLVRRKP
jgi:hypothetical protein